eukprot:1100323-Pelagomonas_calceolata.AAC.3
MQGIPTLCITVCIRLLGILGILQHQAHPLNAQPAWHSMLTGIQLSKPRRISPEKLFLHPRHEYNLEGRDWGSRSLGRALAHILIFALA